MLSAFFKRNVTLKQSAPEDFTVDQYHPDVEGADPGGNRDAVVQQKLGSALFASLGMESPLPSRLVPGCVSSLPHHLVYTRSVCTETAAKPL